ncbi:MAG: LysE family translocator [Alphaproteobacteria bacterium]|nr:LysE family translocator [Alphaproteobacteria bacterium]
MSYETWVAYLIANIVLTLIPGPSVMLVVGLSLTRGLKSALSSILGDMFASVILTILSLVGVGAILVASATLFVIVKWAGVVYMAYLGYCQIRDARNGGSFKIKQQPKKTAIDSFKSGFLAALLNPKAIIFYMAFLTQFMNPEADMLLQFGILVATSTVVIGVLLAGYALLATRAKKAFKSQKAQKYFGYTGGSFLIGGSVLMATTR